MTPDERADKVKELLGVLTGISEADQSMIIKAVMALVISNQFGGKV